MIYKTIEPGEATEATFKTILPKFVKYGYKHEVNAADCEIYKRGKVWIIEHSGDVLYYETHSDNYPFFESAFHYMNPAKWADWKTVGELVTFRQAIREATVQGTDYCDTILEEPLTHKTYRKFMRFARAHDLRHHGSHTF
ncbi:MAG: hypothetical protein WCP85_03355 [Mariniphaga sp.]